MLRRILVITLVIGAAAGIVSLGSALFSNTATVANNTFTSGTLDISTNPTTTVVTYANMATGDSFAAPITVTNAGTLELRYAITSIATNADTKNLMTQLDLTVYSGVTTDDCSAKVFTAGTILYGGPTFDIGSVAGIDLVGDPTAGDDTGDRTLAAGASEVPPLCFYVILPTGSDNSYQGAATTVTFDFAAEQTANN
jgi:spore coat-associated protein N